MMLFINKLNSGLYRKVDKTSNKAGFLVRNITIAKRSTMHTMNLTGMYKINEGTPILFSLDGDKWASISETSNPELFI